MATPDPRRAVVSRALAILALVAALSSLLAPARAVAQSVAQARDALSWTMVTITSADGRAHAFASELADDVDSRARGLMHRRHLPRDQGMLFVYAKVQPASFWMRNTFIPLDLLFIDADGRIVRIHREAVPLDETPIPSGAPIRAVLEIAGGQAARLRLAVGDHVSADDPRALLPPLNANEAAKPLETAPASQ